MVRVQHHTIITSTIHYYFLHRIKIGQDIALLITRNQSVKKTRSHILIHFYFNKHSKYHSHSSFLLPSFTLSPHNKAVRPPFSQSTHHSLLPSLPTAIIPPITPHNRTTKLPNSLRSSRITCSNGEIRYLKNNPGSTSAVPDGSTVTTLSVSYTEIYDTVPANSPLRSN